MTRVFMKDYIAIESFTLWGIHRGIDITLGHVLTVDDRESEALVHCGPASQLDVESCTIEGLVSSGKLELLP